MVLCVPSGEHARALVSFLGNHGFLKEEGPYIFGTNITSYYIRFVNSANVLVMVYIFFTPSAPYTLDDYRFKEMQLDSFIEARFNGDCFTIWRSYSTGTDVCYLSKPAVHIVFYSIAPYTAFSP